MEVGDPMEGVFQKEAPHLLAVGTVKVEGFPPGGAAAVGEVGPEIPQVVAFRAQVVVDHVQQHGQTPAMAGVHQPFQPLGSAIALLHRKGINAVVAPVTAARKLGHRHDFHRGEAQLLEVVQMGDNRVKGAGGGEGAHVQLIDDKIFQGQAEPALVFPGKVGVRHLGGPVHVFRLMPGGRVGTFCLPVETVEITAARPDAVHPPVMIAPGPRGQRHVTVAGSQQMHLNLCRPGRPDQKMALFIAQVNGPQRRG